MSNFGNVDLESLSDLRDYLNRLIMNREISPREDSEHSQGYSRDPRDPRGNLGRLTYPWQNPQFNTNLRGTQSFSQRVPYIRYQPRQSFQATYRSPRQRGASQKRFEQQQFPQPNLENQQTPTNDLRADENESQIHNPLINVENNNLENIDQGQLLAAEEQVVHKIEKDSWSVSTELVSDIDEESLMIDVVYENKEQIVNDSNNSEIIQVIESNSVKETDRDNQDQSVTQKDNTTFDEISKELVSILESSNNMEESGQKRKLYSAKNYDKPPKQILKKPKTRKELIKDLFGSCSSSEEEDEEEESVEAVNNHIKNFQIEDKKELKKDNNKSNLKRDSNAKLHITKHNSSATKTTEAIKNKTSNNVSKSRSSQNDKKISNNSAKDVENNGQSLPKKKVSFNFLQNNLKDTTSFKKNSNLIKKICTMANLNLPLTLDKEENNKKKNKQSNAPMKKLEDDLQPSTKKENKSTKRKVDKDEDYVPSKHSKDTTASHHSHPKKETARKLLKRRNSSPVKEYQSNSDVATASNKKIPKLILRRQSTSATTRTSKSKSTDFSVSTDESKYSKKHHLRPRSSSCDTNKSAHIKQKLINANKTIKKMVQSAVEVTISSYNTDEFCNTILIIHQEAPQFATSQIQQDPELHRGVVYEPPLILDNSQIVTKIDQDSVEIKRETLKSELVVKNDSSDKNDDSEIRFVCREVTPPVVVVEDDDDDEVEFVCSYSGSIKNALSKRLKKVATISQEVSSSPDSKIEVIAPPPPPMPNENVQKPDANVQEELQVANNNNDVSPIPPPPPSIQDISPTTNDEHSISIISRYSGYPLSLPTRFPVWGSNSRENVSEKRRQETATFKMPIATPLSSVAPILSLVRNNEVATPVIRNNEVSTSTVSLRNTQVVAPLIPNVSLVGNNQAAVPMMTNNRVATPMMPTLSSVRNNEVSTPAMSSLLLRSSQDAAAVIRNNEAAARMTSTLSSVRNDELLSSTLASKRNPNLSLDSHKPPNYNSLTNTNLLSSTNPTLENTVRPSVNPSRNQNNQRITKTAYGISGSDFSTIVEVFILHIYQAAQMRAVTISNSNFSRRCSYYSTYFPSYSEQFWSYEHKRMREQSAIMFNELTRLPIRNLTNLDAAVPNIVRRVQDILRTATDIACLVDEVNILKFLFYLFRINVELYNTVPILNKLMNYCNDILNLGLLQGNPFTRESMQILQHQIHFYNSTNSWIARYRNQTQEAMIRAPFYIHPYTALPQQNLRQSATPMTNSKPRGKKNAQQQTARTPQPSRIIAPKKPKPVARKPAVKVAENPNKNQQHEVDNAQQHEVDHAQQPEVDNANYLPENFNASENASDAQQPNDQDGFAIYDYLIDLTGIEDDNSDEPLPPIEHLELEDLKKEEEEIQASVIEFNQTTCVCGEQPKYRCDNCKNAFYCSLSCQEEDWSLSHQNDCRPEEQ